jgi:hypothetical protein
MTHLTSLPFCLWRIRFWHLNSSLGWSLISCQWVKGVSSSLGCLRDVFTYPSDRLRLNCDTVARGLWSHCDTQLRTNCGASVHICVTILRMRTVDHTVPQEFSNYGRLPSNFSLASKEMIVRFICKIKSDKRAYLASSRVSDLLADSVVKWRLVRLVRTKHR